MLKAREGGIEYIINKHQTMIKDKISKINIVIKDTQAQIEDDKSNNIPQSIIDVMQIFLNLNQKLKTFYQASSDSITNDLQ